MNCTDCTLMTDCPCALEPEEHVEDHAGVCCDCFDERQGMPASERTYPRPHE